MLNRNGDEVMKNADMPAMPVVTVQRVGNVEKSTSEATGLTKREMIAMNIASGLVNGAPMPSVRSDIIAQVAVSLTDALLIELSFPAK